MTYETKPYYEDDDKEVMKQRFDKIISLGTPLWIYKKKETMSSAEFKLILSYNYNKDRISYVPFFTCKNIEHDRWYIKFESKGPFNIWLRNGDYSSPQNKDAVFSNEMPKEFNMLSHSIIKKLFSIDWDFSTGFSVYEGEQ